MVYNGVLAANRAVMDSAKPGVSYRDMHVLANKVTLEHLLAGGLLQVKNTRLFIFRAAFMFFTLIGQG